MALANRSVQWIKSQKGQDQLVVDNYIFFKNGRGRLPTVRYWTCSSDGCVVSAKTDGLQLTELKNVANAPDHGHPDDCAKLRDVSLKVNVKRKLDINPELTAKRAYNCELNQLAVADAAFVQPFNSMERSLNRHKTSNRPALPNTAQDWDLPPALTVTLDGRPFVLIDDGAADRIIVFATQENLHRVANANVWWMDGTFSCNPDIFCQLYTIHIKVQHEFMPQLWCLLPDKQGMTYVRLIRLLKQKTTTMHMQLQPTTVHVDFEQAMMTTIRNEFQVEPSGCLFHFSQNILRHVQQTGLQVAYNSNTPPEVRKWIRRLIALPLLPPLRLDQAFNAVVNNAPNVVGSDAMNNYVKDTYMGPNALFDRNTWNCFGMIDRTTNVCEGYHSTLNKHFNHRRPDPFAFVKCLQEQESSLERRVAQLQVGAPAKKRKSKYVLVDEALERLRNQHFGTGFPNINGLLQYMDAVGHQLYDVKH